MEEQAIPALFRNSRHTEATYSKLLREVDHRLAVSLSVLLETHTHFKF